MVGLAVDVEFGAPDVAISAGELAAYRLARMSARLVQGLGGRGRDPEVVWHTLAASCQVDFAISRALTALGRTAPLRGFHLDVRAIRGVRALAPVEAPCSLCVAARVLGRSDAGPGAVDLTLEVALTRNPDAGQVIRFELELLLRRAAA